MDQRTAAKRLDIFSIELSHLYKDVAQVLYAREDGAAFRELDDDEREIFADCLVDAAAHADEFGEPLMAASSGSRSPPLSMSASSSSPTTASSLGMGSAPPSPTPAYWPAAADRSHIAAQDKTEGRIVRGHSEKKSGCVLDGPLRDESDVLHHVYNIEDKRVYVLTTAAYREIISELDTRKRNDHHRIIDEALKFGDYITFKYDSCDDRDEIVDFERGTQLEDCFLDNGHSVIRSRCVFNSALTQIYTEHFGLIDLAAQTLAAEENVPTPGVVLFCYLQFEIDGNSLNSWLYKVLEIDGEDQSFANQVPWASSGARGLNPYADDEDDEDVQIEADLATKNNAITGKAAFITGLTSVYIPDMPRLVAMLPTYNRIRQYVGHEAHVDLIHNELLDAYIVFAKSVKPSTYYRTHITVKPDDRRVKFYVDIYANEQMQGLYRHPHFSLIADPNGYLDLAGYTEDLVKANADFQVTTANLHFYVPVIDVLGGVHERRKIADLDILTRFEVYSAGDESEQLRFLKSLRNDKPVVWRDGGAVVDAEHGCVCAKHMPGYKFRLPRDHRYKTGDTIAFKSARTPDVDAIEPTFQIVTSRPVPGAQREGVKYNALTKQFTIEAQFDARNHCWETEIFGLVPCTDRDKPPMANTLQKWPYLINASINKTRRPQTALCKGTYARSAPRRIEA